MAAAERSRSPLGGSPVPACMFAPEPGSPGGGPRLAAAALPRRASSFDAEDGEELNGEPDVDLTSKVGPGGGRLPRLAPPLVLPPQGRARGWSRGEESGEGSARPRGGPGSRSCSRFHLAARVVVITPASRRLPWCPSSCQPFPLRGRRVPQPCPALKPGDSSVGSPCAYAVQN